MLADVGVTVIVASYRWPDALAISLTSALHQTHGDLEILVVEDGVCPETRAVAAAPGDSRVRYLNLEANSGSQSGPNTLGVEHATHSWIAYLGHDDVWDPRHVERMLATAGRTGASAIHGGCLTIDGIPAERSFMSGLKSWTPMTFVPPSSLMHRRELALSRPIWLDARTARHAIDYQALCELERNGATFASSGIVTVAKIAAAMRFAHLDRRSTAGHQALLDAARDAPTPDVTLQRWNALAAAAEDPSAFAAQPPTPPGSVTDRNRRMRGLPPLGPPITQFDPALAGALPNWHEPELFDGMPFRWTGPAQSTRIVLDAPTPWTRRVAIVCELPFATSDSGLAPFMLSVDSVELPLTPRPEDSRPDARTRRFTSLVDRPSGRIGAPLDIEIRTESTHRPPLSADGAEDERLLGVPISLIEVHSLP